MEAVSATGIVIGLVGSLGNTLRVLQDFASGFACEKFGSDFKDAENAMKRSYSDLDNVQSNLHTTWMLSQHDELLVVLGEAEKLLRNLRDSIQNVETLRSKLSLRWHSRVLLRRDMDVAEASTVLALEMMEMIRIVQGLTRHAKPLIELSRSRSQIMMSVTEHLATTWQRSHTQPLSTVPDTKAEQMFTWMAFPEEQDRFHQRCQAERVTGTCDWFLETKEYTSWRENPVSTGDKGILWCQGKSGIGKTVLASKIIDRLRTSHFVAYFYMSSGGRVHSASDVIASLLRQLCMTFHIVPRRLKELYERSEPEPNIRLELDDMLEALRETSRDIDQPIVIVIDGLDECNMREQKDFIRIVTGLKETSWKSLVTSRCEQDIWSKACKDCSQFSIKDNNVENDIRNFVDSALRGNEPVDSMLSNGAFRLEVIETLTSRARGMFYWATLQLRRILDQTHISGIKKALADIPSEVGGIVKDALDMINMQDPIRARLANQTLALLTAAKSPITDVAPMTARAISHAMGISHILDLNSRLSKLIEDEIPNPASIIECCMGLVAIDPVTQVVTLAHFDIAQYMQKHWDDLFSWKEKLMLANITLVYLSLDTFSTGPCRQVDEFIRRLEAYPFLDYASRHWGHYAREAMLLQDADAEQGKQKVIENVNRLLNDRMSLESSLQICDLNSRPSKDREALLRNKEKDFALHAGKLSSVSKLQVAIRYGFSAIARKIIDSRPDVVSDQDAFGTSALHEAAQAGWDDLVDMLLKARAPPSLKNKEGKAPVYIAAQNGNTKIISLISEKDGRNELLPELSGSFDPENGRSAIVPMGKDLGDPLALEEAFCDAAEAGKLDVIAKLLKDNVNLADSKKCGKSAMIFAIQGGHEKILEKLLDADASFSCPDFSPGDQIPLHQAIRCSNENMVSMLLDRGANVETCDELRRTALFETLHCHSLDGAVLLLDQGISICSGDHKGNTVLHEAARMGAVEHASLFIDQGIKLDDFNEEGLAPLHLAARHNHCRIVNDILEKGVDPNLIDRQAGWTPLMYAASTGFTQLCHILLSCGADVAKASSDHKTSLMIAANAGHYQIIQLLLGCGADVNGLGTGSPTPLLLAAYAGHAQLVRLLVERGADVNALDNDSNSALNVAANAGHASTVRLLLEKGADPGALRWEPEISSNKAEENSRRQIQSMLRDYGVGMEPTGK